MPSPDPADPSVDCKRVRHPVILLVVLSVLVALTCAVGYLSYTDSQYSFLGTFTWGKSAAFFLILALLLASVVSASLGTTGLWWGLLIDDRNRMSLSRFQAALWTLVGLAAILVAGFFNVRLEQAQKVAPITASSDAKVQKAQEDERAKQQLVPGGPLDFRIPAELWVVMGISATSLVTAPLILKDKMSQQAPQEATDRAQATLTAAGQPNGTPRGLVLTNKCPQDASWTDLFQTEEVGNGGHLDLAKLQNFYFTIILVFTYIAAIANAFSAASEVLQLPPFSSGMVALLGISHAAYLANKARTQTPKPTDGGGGA
jgi:hypothetical protein